MKHLFLSLLLILASCGGVGTETVDRDTGDKNTKLEQDLSKNKGCNEDVKNAIEAVAELCAANMNVDINRMLCLLEAKNLRSKHPDFVCTLDDGRLIDADYISKSYITKIENQKADLEKSGIFK